jgi:hypothetical protein
MDIEQNIEKNITAGFCCNIYNLLKINWLFNNITILQITALARFYNILLPLNILIFVFYCNIVILLN